MKVQMLTVAVLLLVLSSSAPAPSETLGDWDGTPERQPLPGGPGEDPWPPGEGVNNLPGQGLEGSRPPVSARGKAVAKTLLGSGKQEFPPKHQGLPLQPSRSWSLGLRHHLKGHGKFNGDTHSCHSIQSRPCQKPSNCSGCLGLYTCKLPTGTCDLKAVSRQRGGFLQSIHGPEGRRVLLLP